MVLTAGDEGMAFFLMGMLSPWELPPCLAELQGAAPTVWACPGDPQLWLLSHTEMPPDPHLVGGLKALLLPLLLLP